VAVGLTGSFPALNICTFAALSTLGLQALVVSSVSASEWGANQVDFMWLDMERVLQDKQIFGFRSRGASLGGIDDRGIGMSREGRALLDAAIERAGATKLESKSLSDAVEKRMVLYGSVAGSREIKAYINVGGGAASVGTHIGKKMFKPGLNTQPPRGNPPADSVMLRFSRQDVPVIHLSRISLLAQRYGLSQNPERMPAVGEGTVYEKPEYNAWLAALGIVAILGVMLAFIRLDVGLRILRSSRKREGDAQPQQMV